MAKYKQHGQKLNNNNKWVLNSHPFRIVLVREMVVFRWGTLLCLPCENAIMFLGKSECVV